MAISDFGSRLKQVFNGATNKQIAEILAISAPAVQSYTAGRVPPYETLLKIAEVTNCNLHWLLTGEERPARERIAERRTFDPIIDRKGMADFIREIVRDELKMRVQDLGTADEFDVAAAVIEYNDPHQVMRDWFAFEGREYSDDYGVQFFKGWEAYSLDEKIAAVRDAKKALDRTQEK